MIIALTAGVNNAFCFVFRVILLNIYFQNIHVTVQQLLYHIAYVWQICRAIKHSIPSSTPK